MTVKLYEVGGSIRDSLLGILNNDRDFVAVCPKGWDHLVSWADTWLDKVFLITPEYFTIRGIKGGEIFDFVLARKEGAYSDGRHPDSVEPGTLEDDLARRDFTMNAIARCADTQTLIDPFYGQEAIEDRVIRCVGSAEDRMQEDSLRLLRALRFMVTKDFYLDGPLLSILKSDGTRHWSASDLLENVSRERIREELQKMFKYDSVITCRTLFDERIVHEEIVDVLFQEDLWLNPTMAKR